MNLNTYKNEIVITKYESISGVISVGNFYKINDRTYVKSMPFMYNGAILVYLDGVLNKIEVTA